MPIIVKQIIQLKPCLRTFTQALKGLLYYILLGDPVHRPLWPCVERFDLDPCDNSRNKSQFSEEGFIGGSGMCDCMTSQQQSKVIVSLCE